MKPLAEKIRPTIIEDVFGQEHLFNQNSQIKRMIDTGIIQNIILWGPPGSGKTTIARIIANHSKYHVISLSAVISGTAEIKQIFIDAQKRKLAGINSLLIIDEIHHFNKTQQDIFLPYLEDGTVTIIGATTENPSFELNSALLSRCMILVLKSLDKSSLEKITKRAELNYQKKLPLNDQELDKLYEMSAGDGRYLLNICETILSNTQSESPDLLSSISARSGNYDKSRDMHHNLISALHKSIRGSDPDASLYWLRRMLDAGENPYYILRRLVRAACEDIAIADPNALVQVMNAKNAYEFLGSPEGELAIVQATLYLATAPKSNSVYLADKKAKISAKKYNSQLPPNIILNAPTKLMKDQGYGKDYIYDHDTIEGFSGQDYFPSIMGREKYYYPQNRGYEKEINKRIDYWQKLRDRKNS